MAQRTAKRTKVPSRSGSKRTTSTQLRAQTVSQLKRLPDVKMLPNANGQTDAEECFLPLLLLFGLWGGSRALRNRGAYGGYGGWPGSGYGGYGGGYGGMMPNARQGQWGGPWGNFWGGGRGYGAGRGFGGWPFMF